MGQATYAYYVRPDDDYAPGAASVTASVEDPDYPAANLVSENAAKPAKLTGVTGTWVLHFSSAIQPVFAALIYQYLDAALGVTLQANSSDSWGSPPYSQAFTIPAKRRDGPSTQRWTNNVGLVVTGSPSYAYWRLNVSGTNSQAVAVGKLMLASAYHVVELLLAESIDESDDKSLIVQPTELGVETVYTMSGPRRSFSGVTALTDASGVTVEAASGLRALDESAEGRAHPFLWLPYGLSAEPQLVRFESENRQRTHRQGNVQYWPFSVREVSRGIPWP